MRSRRARIVLIGHFSVNAESLERELNKIAQISGFRTLYSRIEGDFHLIGSLEGTTVIYGGNSGIKKTFWGKEGERIILSDKADEIARILGAKPDPARLSLKLLDNLPHPFCTLPIWKEVNLVPEGSAALLDELRPLPLKIDKWWKFPETQMSLIEGSYLLRKAVNQAVSVYSRSSGSISCDLSGGLDSTPLFLVASALQPDLTYFYMQNNDPSDDDKAWMREAEKKAPLGKKITVSCEDIPGFYDNLSETNYSSDDPSISLLSVNRLRYSLSLIRESGSEIHMNGVGGDQVYTGVPNYLHGLWRRSPFKAANFTRSYLAFYRNNTGSTLRALLDSTPYTRWLDRTLTTFKKQEIPSLDYLLDWGYLPPLPSWATSEMQEACIAGLEEAFQIADKDPQERGQHADVSSYRMMAHQARVMNHSSSLDDICSVSPYFNDSILDACLSIYPEERCAPDKFKPLAKIAFQDTLPEKFQKRTTKTDGGVQVAQNFMRNADLLRRSLHNSRLHEFGFISEVSLDSLFIHSYISDDELGDFQTLLSTSLWLDSHLNKN